MNELEFRLINQPKGIKLIIITGGAGFIGSNFVNGWLRNHDETILNIDKLTYAGNLDNVIQHEDDPNHQFMKADICDPILDDIIQVHRPRAIIHFAAESHVDRSILGPAAFIQTNINGTFNLLEAARKYWTPLPAKQKETFRFIHISTDEVFGSLALGDSAFTEQNAYQPNSPYSASKASSDHLVRAYFHTYGFPTIITNCSNNYGPYQFPEKLIPLMIANALAEKSLPIYGDGKNIRDWLHVADHCQALLQVLNAGIPGETYNIGSNNERSNLEIVTLICEILDSIKPRTKGSYRELIKFVADRPGHDFRYAIDSSKIKRELNWQAAIPFRQGLEETVKWYLDNQVWVNNLNNRRAA